MIRLDRVTKRFGGEPVFQRVSMELTPGRAIGLVGPNGAGKTTIFRLLTEELQPDEGRVLIPQEMTVGLLPQTVGEMTGGTIFERMISVKSEVLELERQIEELTEALTSTSDPQRQEELSDAYGDAEEAYKLAGGYELRADAKRILAGMGFEENDFTRDVSELSGGWRMRLVLAGLLLQRPDVLLMDEPTNHLDVPSLEWIEGFLANYEGTVVVISHDRYFLNRLVNVIISIEPDGLLRTEGNYDDYEVAVEERNAQRERERAKQEKEIKRIQAFVNKFRYNANKAAQVQSRVKKLEKIELIETVDQRKRVAFRFPDAPHSGKRVLTCEEVSKAYGPDTIVYDDLDFHIQRGERIALVGPNGQGKSTLLKLLANSIAPDSGTVETGYNVVRGYFAQHHIEGLNLDNTLLEEMETRATTESFPECRSILGAFLFSGDDVYKRIRVLSGGEKHRLALATLLLEPSNLLLLDEPTNHLDMRSREVLKDALLAYEGTVIVVSHDRSFLNGLATKTVHVEGGGVTPYVGDYAYYVRKKAQEIEEQGDAQKPSTQGSDDASVGNENEQKSLSHKEVRRLKAERRKARKRRVGSLEKKLSACEQNIEEFEAERGKLAAMLADQSFYDEAGSTEFAEATRKHGKLEQQIAHEMERWEKIGEQIESIDAELDKEFALGGA